MVRIDEALCVNCGSCARACPMGVIQYKEGKTSVLQGRRCIECMHCVSICPKNAVIFDGIDYQTREQPETEIEKLAAKEPVKAYALKLLAEKYDIEEEDFLSAEIEVVPAGRARDLGFDRSMILGYGHDDSSCAYPSLVAQLALDETPKRTAITVLVDKEEIGSVGATGMASQFFENVIAVLMELVGEGGDINLRRALAASSMLSSDVSAGLDPAYASVFEPKNAAYLGHGLVFNKYTGARGKSGSNDASAEVVGTLRRIFADNGVVWQMAELGKVDQGGGGTVALFMANRNIDTIDAGVPVLSMHAPYETVSKFDCYMTYKGVKSFYLDR